MGKSVSKDPQQQEIVKRRHFAFRLNIFFFCTFVIFSILIVRLAILQFVEGTVLAKEEDLSTETRNSIPPIRGNIYDRTGYYIAKSTSTQSLYYHYDSTRDQNDVIKLAKQLADIFAKYSDSGSDSKDGSDKKISADDIVKTMDVGYDVNKKERKLVGYSFSPRRLKSNLSKEEIAYILEHREQFKGIEIVEESVREYNPEKLATQLIGYLRPFSVAREEKWGLDYYKKIAKLDDPKYHYLDTEGVGFDGLELMYQEQLRGQNGMKTYPVNASQQIIGQVTLTAPIKGNNLYLTIDKDVQLTAQKAIMDQLTYMKSAEARALRYPAMGRDARAGYAVAMEVQTGKVIAMASMPDYNSNIWQKGRITQKQYDQIQFYMKNGTIREVYPDYKDYKERIKHPSSLVPLGSTMKPLTVLLGLNEKLITPFSKYNDRGVFYFGRKGHETPIPNSDGHVYGSMDASRAIEKSSNTFMAEMIGNQLYKSARIKDPVNLWDKYMKEFGLGIKTGSGLPGEDDGTIEYFHEAKSGSAQSALVYAAFGQQGRYTPLQLAQYAAMLANHGKRLKPQFVDKIATIDGQVVQTSKPEILNQVKFPDEYWDVIQKGMLKVFKRGFDGFPYAVAAKTGTSEQQVAGGALVNNAVFIAYAPADNPVLAVAVVVPDGGFGAWGAAPIARKIFDAYDEHIGLTGKPRLKPQTVPTIPESLQQGPVRQEELNTTPAPETQH